MQFSTKIQEGFVMIVTTRILLPFIALIALPAAARPPLIESAELTLAMPATQAEFIIDGALWTCRDTACRAAAVADMPAARSCQRVVARTGAVTTFTWRGKALSANQIAVCNTKAKI
jgi:hypothetical protein